MQQRPGLGIGIAVLAAATVGVRRCWPWETAATLLPSAGRRKGLRRPRGEKRGAQHEVAAARLQLVWFASCIQIVLTLYHYNTVSLLTNGTEKTVNKIL